MIQSNTEQTFLGLRSPTSGEVCNMSEAVERIAEALRERCEGPRGDFRWADDAGLPQYRKMAVAALEAIQPSTDALEKDMKTSADELLYLADQERHIRGMLHPDDHGELRASAVKEWALRLAALAVIEDAVPTDSAITNGAGEASGLTGDR